MDQGTFLDRLREAIQLYYERFREGSGLSTHRDPFSDWFRSLAEPDLRMRVLLVLVDARFDQGTLAESALANTQIVYKHGILARGDVLLDEIPALKTRRWVSAHRWREAFHRALPALHELSWAIVNQRQWSAGDLLNCILARRVPYFGQKTARLAVRWLHELVPELQVDMIDSEVPIDSLLYRVACRLGIIDPTKDKYSGPGSSAHLKIQECARKLFPQNPSLMDEPLWMMGRQRRKGGYCYPIDPSCDRGCIFASFCPRCSPDVDPASLGYRAPGSSSRELGGNKTNDKVAPPPGSRQHGLLVVVSCVKKKIWTVRPDAPQSVPAEEAYVSSYFRKNASYARRFGQQWCLLSAKYGFVLPHERIENYDFTFRDRDPRLVTPETLRKQIREKGLDRFKDVQVLGGREYVKEARRAFAAYKTTKIHAPLASLRIGQAMRAVDQAVRMGKPLP